MSETEKLGMEIEIACLKLKIESLELELDVYKNAITAITILAPTIIVDPIAAGQKIMNVIEAVEEMRGHLDADED